MPIVQPLRGWSLAILGALEPASSPQLPADGNAAVVAFKHYLSGPVARRRQHTGDPHLDVLTRLIQSEAGGERLSKLELLHNCIFLLNAGHETTTNLIGNGMHALLTHREQWRRLLADRSLLDTAVEELLRFESTPRPRTYRGWKRASPSASCSTDSRACACAARPSASRASAFAAGERCRSA